MKLNINALQQKLRRRNVKIESLQNKLRESTSNPSSNPADRAKANRQAFELKQALEDKRQLEEDIQALLEVFEAKKTEEKDTTENKETENLAALHGVDLNDVMSNIPSHITDQALETLGLNPTTVDDQEVQFYAL